MIVKINYTLPNGAEDSLILEKDTVEEIRAAAKIEVESRGATNPWSEVLQE